ncbi:hypothetical protein PM082_019206 [Marasmius tenuissimus]|nr:hypothetical protein PM082_019206 [Marasmius tenuissimus]
MWMCGCFYEPRWSLNHYQSIQSSWPSKTHNIACCARTYEVVGEVRPPAHENSRKVCTGSFDGCMKVVQRLVYWRGNLSCDEPVSTQGESHHCQGVLHRFTNV